MRMDSLSKSVDLEENEFKLPNIAGAHILLSFKNFNELTETNVELRKSADREKGKQKTYEEILRQLSLFLRYLMDEEFFIKAVDEFNSQSKEAKIHLINGEVRIEIL